MRSVATWEGKEKVGQGGRQGEAASVVLALARKEGGRAHCIGQQPWEVKKAHCATANVLRCAQRRARAAQRAEVSVRRITAPKAREDQRQASLQATA